MTPENFGTMFHWAYGCKGQDYDLWVTILCAADADEHPVHANQHVHRNEYLEIGPYEGHIYLGVGMNVTYSVDIDGEIISALGVYHQVQGPASVEFRNKSYEWINEPTPVQMMKLKLYEPARDR